MEKSKENSIISSLGKGLYVKASLEEKNIFVEVGSGVLVKKTPEAAKKIIENQIKRLSEAKLKLLEKFELCYKNLNDLLVEFKEKKGANQHSH